MEENEYLKAWFKGFSNSLELISTAERQKVMCQCGKSWAEAEILSVYQQAYNASGGDLMKTIRLLQDAFSPNIIYEPVDEFGIPEGKCFDVMYFCCVCDLVKARYVDSPFFCESTKQSLLFVWEELVGKGNVSVETKQTILNGSNSCIFRVTFR